MKILGRTATCLTAAAALLLGPVWVAPPAFAAATCVDQPTGDTNRINGGVAAEDRRREAFPRADVSIVCAEITSGVVSVSLGVAEPTNPATDPAWTGDTYIQMDLVIDDGQSGYFVSYKANRVGASPTESSGALVRVAESGDVACRATASFDGTRYGATFPSSCIGSPTSLDVNGSMVYDPYPCAVVNDATPLYSDSGDVGRVNAGTGTAPAPTEMANAQADVCRLSGLDRYSTAVAASAAAWGATNSARRADVVVLARGDAFPDALAGTPLAAAKRGPLLLTPGTSLSTVTANEIKRVLPGGSFVFLLGGTAAISDGVATTIRDMGYKPVRLAGPDRYATATEISRQIPNPQTIYLATGLSFPSALVAGAAAGAKSVVVLTADGTMPPTTSDYLGQHPGVPRIAVGKEAAAADPSAEAIVGADQYQTSRLLAERVFGVSPDVVGVASGTVFPDGLSGGAHNSWMGDGPLLLSEAAALPATIRDYLRAHTSIRRAHLYGGTAALSQAVEDSVRNSINGR